MTMIFPIEYNIPDTLVCFSSFRYSRRIRSMSGTWMYVSGAPMLRPDVRGPVLPIDPLCIVSSPSSDVQAFALFDYYVLRVELLWQPTLSQARSLFSFSPS